MIRISREFVQPYLVAGRLALLAAFVVAGMPAMPMARGAADNGAADNGAAPTAAVEAPEAANESVVAEGDTASLPLDLREQAAFRAALARIAPSVVRIETIGGLERVEELRIGTSPTTGWVVDPSGYIITSAFNFLNRPSSIIVRLPDGTRKPATLVATDHNRMLALLRINVEQPLPMPEIAPAAELRVGQWALGVGRALDAQEPSVAVGVVSALGRVWGKAVQTDAAVSPNNYGGPLVDIRGRVMGALVPLSPESNEEAAGIEWYDSGIGFAIPAETILALLPRLEKGDDLRPGVAGLGFGGEGFNAEAVLARCPPGSPAAEAGLRAGDRVLAVDGASVARVADVRMRLGPHYAGDRIALTVERAGQRLSRELTLVDHLEPYEMPFLGLLPEPADESDAAAGPAGLGIRYVYADSPAAAAGIAAGDRLLAIGETKIGSLAEARQALAEHKVGDEIRLALRRGDDERTVALRLASLPSALPPADLPRRASRAAAPSATADDEAGAEGSAPEAAAPPVGIVKLQVANTPIAASAYVPADPTADYGLLIWLCGDESDKEREVLDRWRAAADARRLIVVVLRPSSPPRWHPLEMMALPALIEQLRRNYPIDDERIALGGEGEAGGAAWPMAWQLKERVRGVVLVDAAPSGSVGEFDPLQPLSLVLAWAAKGPQAQHIERARQAIEKQKLPLTIIALGAEPRPLRAAETMDIARWIDALDRL